MVEREKNSFYLQSTTGRQQKGHRQQYPKQLLLQTNKLLLTNERLLATLLARSPIAPCCKWMGVSIYSTHRRRRRRLCHEDRKVMGGAHEKGP